MTDSYTRTHYPKAPITEAVIGFHWHMGKAEDLADLINLAKSNIKSETRFLQHTDIVEVQQIIEFQASGEPKVQEVRTVSGVRFDDVARGYAAQVTSHGFFVSKLAPYDSWEPFSAEAMELWAIISKLRPTLSLSRLATRFINRIDIDASAERIDLDDFFFLGVKVPEDQGLMISNFQAMIQMIDQTQPTVTLQVRCGSTPSPLPNHFGFLLDIEAFEPLSETALPLPTAMAEILSRLQQSKNKVFEASLHPSLKQRYL